MKLAAATPGDQVPQEPWRVISDRVRALQRTVQEGFAAAGELTGAVIRRGILQVLDGGSVVVQGTLVDPATGIPTGATFEQLRLGALPDDPAYNRPDGSRQAAFRLKLDDGTLALSAAETRADDGQYAQALIMWDRVGTPGGVVAADGNSGRGLARPHLGQFAGPGDTNIARWPSTTQTTWTAVWSQYFEIQNPKLSWNTQLYVPAGCSGQFRMLYGTDVIGTSQQVDGGTSGSVAQWFGSRVTLPGDIGDELLLSVEAIVVVGAGEIAFRFVQNKGDQS